MDFSKAGSLDQTDPGRIPEDAGRGGGIFINWRLTFSGKKIEFEPVLNLKISRFGRFSKLNSPPPPLLCIIFACQCVAKVAKMPFCFFVNCQLLLSNSRLLPSKHYRNVWTAGFQTFLCCGVVQLLSKWTHTRLSVFCLVRCYPVLLLHTNVWERGKKSSDCFLYLKGRDKLSHLQRNNLFGGGMCWCFVMKPGCTAKEPWDWGEKMLFSAKKRDTDIWNSELGILWQNTRCPG